MSNSKESQGGYRNDSLEKVDVWEPVVRKAFDGTADSMVIASVPPWPLISERTNSNETS
jgi:hypothetical protein